MSTFIAATSPDSPSASDPYTAILPYDDTAELDVLGKYLAGNEESMAYGEHLDAIWDAHRLYPYLTQLERPGLMVLTHFLAWARKMGLYTPGQPSSFLEQQIWVPVGAVGPLLILGHHDYRVPLDAAAVTNAWCSGRCLVTKRFYDATLAAVRELAEQGGFTDSWVDPAEGTDAAEEFEASPNFETAEAVFKWLAGHCPMRDSDVAVVRMALSANGASAAWPVGWDAAAAFIRMGYRLIDVSSCHVPKACADMVPPSLVADYHGICVFATPRTLFCVLPDPDRHEFIDHLLGRLSSGSNLRVVLLLGDQVAIDYLSSGGVGADTLEIHGSSGAIREQRVDFSFESSDLEGFDPRSVGNVVEDYCKWVMMRAVKLRASDSHFEQLSSGEGRVRFRIGGDCRIIDRQPAEFMRGVVQVIRAGWAGAQGNDNMAPGGGRFTFKLDSTVFDVRLESIGASGWDFPALSLRFLGGGFRDLNSIGFAPKPLALFNVMIHRPDGFVVVAGATGSGKSTTLTAAIAAINTPDLRILTAEDPVEYRVDGAVQVDVDKDRGRPFGKVIKSYMRQDPDVILVGEIRDLEAAEEAAQAALTGHLVFASLHASSAADVPMRLMELGLPRPVVANVLTGMTFQVLVPKLCPNCKVPVPLLEAETRSFMRVKCERMLKPGLRVMAKNPKGCRTCVGGYKGRVLATEVYPVYGVFKEMLKAEVSSQELAAAYTMAGHEPYYNNILSMVIRGDVAMADALPHDPYWWDVDGSYLNAGADALRKLQLSEAELFDELDRRKRIDLAKIPSAVIDAEIAVLRDKRLREAR